MSIASFVLLGLVLLTLSGVVLAQEAPAPVGLQLIPDSGLIEGPNDTCNFVTGEFHFDCIPLYLAYLIRLAFGLAGGFAVFEIMKGGYEYAFSGLQGIGLGPDKESAKKRITHALVGLGVVVLAYLIVDTIVSIVFLGI